MTCTFEKDGLSKEWLNQARRRKETYEKFERESRRNFCIKNHQPKQMFRSMTPPLPKNYPELKSLFLENRALNKTSGLHSCSSGETDGSSGSCPEYLSSESGASITEAISPVSCFSAERINGVIKLNDVQSSIRVTPQKLTDREDIKSNYRKEKVLEDILARQMAINYLMRNLWVLDKKAVSYLFERLKTTPFAAYWKMITMRDCVDEVQIRRANKFEGEALHAIICDEEDSGKQVTEENHSNLRLLARRKQISQLLAAKENKREVLKELLLKFVVRPQKLRLQARRKQISQLLTAKENKRLVLKELRRKSLKNKIQKLKQMRGRVILDIANVDLEHEIQELKQKRGRVILDMANLHQADRCNKNIEARLNNKVDELLRNKIQMLKQQRGRVILAAAEARNTQRRNETVASRLEMSLKEVLRKDLTQRLIDRAELSARVSDQKLSEGPKFIAPGPKEIFLRTVLNKLLTKREKRRNNRDSLYFFKMTGVPERMYSKLKVNQVITKIRLVRERQLVRRNKRMMNQEIMTYSRKAAVVREINKTALDIQEKVGLLPTTCPFSLSFNADKEADFQVSAEIKAAQEKHALMVKQAHAEVRQIRLKQSVLTEIKVAGMKIRVNKEIRKLAMKKELTQLRLRKGKVVLAMDRITKAYSTKIFPQNGGNSLKKILNETICQRRRKAIVCKNIKTHQRSIELKSKLIQEIKTIELKGKVVQEIKARGLKMKLMAELRQWSRKQMLVKVGGADCRFQKLTRSSEIESVMRRARRKVMERARLQKESRRMVNAIQQVGKARKLKKEINTIIRTHFHMKQVVNEIKTRFQTVENKDRMIDELKKYISRIKRENAKRKFSWREQRSRLHQDLRNYFWEKLRNAKLNRFSQRDQRVRLHKELHTYFNKQNNEEEEDWEWFSKLAISRQMALKKEVNREIKQHKLTFLRHQQEEKLDWVSSMPISRQMALKKIVNNEIKHHKEIVSITNLPISRQMSLKKRVNKELKQHMRHLKKDDLKWVRSMPISKQMFLKNKVIKELKERGVKFSRREWDSDCIRSLPISRQMLLKKGVNQEIRQIRFKYLLQLELVTRSRTVDLKSLLCKEILNKGRPKLLAREQWPLRSRQHKKSKERKQRLESIPENACIVKDMSGSLQIAQFSTEIRQHEHQKALKKQMLQELRRVKQKMAVCREINQIGAAARDYRAVVQDIQAFGDKARAMQQIKNKDHWLLNSYNIGKRVKKEARLFKTVIKGHSGQPEETRASGNQSQVSRSGVIERKSKTLFELKVHFAKTKCMHEIRQLSMVKRNHALLIMELKQRVNFARCVRDITSGSYYLNHVSRPVDISPVVMVKQQMALTKVNTVIRQAGLKIKLNSEIIYRHKKCSRKRIIGKIDISAKARLQDTAKVTYTHVIKELEQRWRHRDIVKEIKIRQKQIFWKGQCCIIIRQGGNKIRVNKEIRSIARQKYLKKQINTVIKQGGLKSRVQLEIRHLRKVAAFRKQKALKAKVNMVIRRMAKAREQKRLQRIGINQKILKAKCNKEIRRERTRPLRKVLTPQLKRATISQEIGGRNENVPTANTKLVKLVTRYSEEREKQDIVIRKLTQEITEQRADFVALNKRVVDDKKELYRMLEDLMRENENLTQTLMRQTNVEKKMKSLDKGQRHYKNKQVYRQHRQHQQTPASCQGVQELFTTKLSGGGKSLSFQGGTLKQREVIPQIVN